MLVRTKTGQRGKHVVVLAYTSSIRDYREHKLACGCRHSQKLQVKKKKSPPSRVSCRVIAPKSGF